MARHNHKNLYIYKDGIELSVKIYQFAECLPEKEKYGLWSQMTRAGYSIPTNIAEGSARTNRSFKSFLRIALGSAFELDTLLTLCKRLGYGDPNEIQQLQEEVQKEQKMILNFIDRLPDDKTFIPPALILLAMGFPFLIWLTM